ncbi:mCG117742 [Mus musculus]|nr:mCG117742 [Mus musculus]
MTMCVRLRRLFQRANVDGRETREGSMDAGLPCERNEGRRRWTWRMWMAHRQTSSPVPVTSNQFEKEEEELMEEIQLISQEKNGLRDYLNLTLGSKIMRLNQSYEELKLKQKELMTLQHDLEMATMEAREENEELKKEINFYSNLHSRALMENNLIKKKLMTLQQESKEVQAEWASIQQHLDVNLSGKDEQENNSILDTQEHQVSETARELGLATDQEDSILQDELPPQEAPAEELSPQEAPAEELPPQEAPAEQLPPQEGPAEELPPQESPAEHHLQHPQSFSDESSYITYPEWE